MPQSVFQIGTKLAVETNRGSAPSGFTNGRPWWSGGRWADVITTRLPNIRDRQEIIFPSGKADDRIHNAQSPIATRQWSEGEINFPVVTDVLAMLLYGAMGSASVDVLFHSTQTSLITDSRIETDPQTFTIAASNQPPEGGAILRFDVKGGLAGGTFSISGIDVYGNGASESIFVPGDNIVHSRTSFSSIGANGIRFSGDSGGSFTCIAVKSYTITFTSGPSAPTLALELLGTPIAGAVSGGSRSIIYSGQLVQRLTLDAAPNEGDGLFMAECRMQGEPTTGTCNATSLNSPSPIKVWPAWTLRATRDNGTTYNRISDFSLTIDTGNRNYLPAANRQEPQGGFFGPFEATGRMSMLFEDEVEFRKWKGTSMLQLYADWVTPMKLTSTINVQLSASLPMFFEGDIDYDDDDGIYSMTGDYRIVQGTTYPFQFRLVSGLPGTALSEQLSPTV